MNEEIKKRWIRALRSGKYEQGNGYLKRVNIYVKESKPQYCCLGVLCDLAEQEGVVTSKVVGDITHYNGRSNILSIEVAGWAGIDNTLGVLPNYTDAKDSVDLTLLNDSWGESFSTIADVIERYA